MVVAGKLLECESRAAPAGKTSSSPATGAVPPQLAALVQKLFGPAPLQVRVLACTKGEKLKSSSERSNRWFIFQSVTQEKAGKGYMRDSPARCLGSVWRSRFCGEFFCFLVL